ncbi:MAG TPA: hypothetical protein VFV75_17455 [Candidatus Polarisedimenticolaceae bacterium]|nr:hypothetical protein [Candidatus Polarisedimenticolaceae bacterium]
MRDEEAIRALRTYPDVQAVRMERGQVLQYPGHYPLGVWVVLSGGLRLIPGQQVLDVDLCVLPPLCDLDRQAAQGAVVERAADALFVPHSVAREDEAVRRLLEQLAAPAVREVR